MSEGPLADRHTPVFDETLRLLEAKGCDIVDMSRDQSYIETERALYAVVEEPKWNISRVYPQFSRTILAGKNFAIHGPRLHDKSIYEISKMGFEDIARGTSNVAATVATTEMQISRNVDAFELPEPGLAKPKK